MYFLFKTYKECAYKFSLYEYKKKHADMNFILQFHQRVLVKKTNGLYPITAFHIADLSPFSVRHSRF